MAGIEKELKQDDKRSDKQKEKDKAKKAKRDDIDELDEQEAYFKWLEENPEAGLLQKEEEDFDIEYDADGNPIYRYTAEFRVITHTLLTKICF